jgi:3-dehydroquinate synthase
LTSSVTKIRVDLGERGYDVFVGRGVLGKLAENLRRQGGSPVAVVTDANVKRCCWRAARRFFPRAAGLAVIRPGEASKSLKTLEKLYSSFLDFNLDRSSVVVAFGGGVVGDLAGFAAATFMRGIDYLQVPTTLLAAVDSSVGGKTAVDLPRGKNLVGAFYQPRGVYVDTSFFATLPEKQWLAGLAEVAKYGVILDEKFFSYLERNAEAVLSRCPEVVRYVVARCVQLKAEVVSRDEREGSLRAILNFGHTLGHAIELDRGMPHGFAISAGMALAARIAVSLGLAQAAEMARIGALLSRFGLPSEARGLDWARVKEYLLHDKKARGGLPRFVLPRRIGEVKIGVEVPMGLVREAVRGKL